MAPEALDSLISAAHRAIDEHHGRAVEGHFHDGVVDKAKRNVADQLRKLHESGVELNTEAVEQAAQRHLHDLNGHEARIVTAADQDGTRRALQSSEGQISRQLDENLRKTTVEAYHPMFPQKPVAVTMKIEEVIPDIEQRISHTREGWSLRRKNITIDLTGLNNEQKLLLDAHLRSELPGRVNQGAMAGGKTTLVIDNMDPGRIKRVLGREFTAMKAQNGNLTHHASSTVKPLAVEAETELQAIARMGREENLQQAGGHAMPVEVPPPVELPPAAADGTVSTVTEEAGAVVTEEATGTAKKVAKKVPNRVSAPGADAFFDELERGTAEVHSEKLDAGATLLDEAHPTGTHIPAPAGEIPAGTHIPTAGATTVEGAVAGAVEHMPPNWGEITGNVGVAAENAIARGKGEGFWSRVWSGMNAPMEHSSNKIVRGIGKSGEAVMEHSGSALTSVAEHAHGMAGNVLLAGAAGVGLLALGASLSTPAPKIPRMPTAFDEDGNDLKFAGGEKSTVDVGGIAMPTPGLSQNIGQGQSSGWLQRMEQREQMARSGIDLGPPRP